MAKTEPGSLSYSCKRRVRRWQGGLGWVEPIVQIDNYSVFFPKAECHCILCEPSRARDTIVAAPISLQIFFPSWISRFGVPKTITSDRGPQFTSSVWPQFCQMFNIYQAGLVFVPAGFFTFRLRRRQETVQELFFSHSAGVFECPGLVMP